MLPAVSKAGLAAKSASFRDATAPCFTTNALPFLRSSGPLRRAGHCLASSRKRRPCIPNAPRWPINIRVASNARFGR
jgi:hypothetical protein